MSIQIYNGFVFKNATSLDQAFMLIKEMRDEIREEIHQAHAQHIIENAVANHDYDLNFNPVELKDIKEYIRIEENSFVKEVMEARKGKESHSFDFKMDIAIAPFEGKIYGRVFSANIQAQNIFIDNKNIKSYQFWNITDKPDELSSDEWKRRYEVWNSIFKSGNNAETEMLRINIVDHPYFIKADKINIIDNISNKKRTDNVVRKRSDDLIPPPPPNSTMMEIISHINKYKKSEECKNNIKHLKDNIVLKPLFIE